jgi:hypothetical protein
MNAGVLAVDFNSILTVHGKSLANVLWAVKAACGRSEIRFHSGELGEEK